MSCHTSPKKRARPAPRSLFFQACNLPPVPFAQFPMIAPASPPMSNPALPLVRWTIPTAGCPNVLAAFVTVISIDPDIAAIGWRTTSFNDRGGRPNPNHNLRKRCRRYKYKSKQYRHCNLLDHESNSPWLHRRNRFVIPTGWLFRGRAVEWIGWPTTTALSTLVQPWTCDY